MNKYFNDVSIAMGAISEVELNVVHMVLKMAKSENATVYTLGNGGSAATASHFANDLLKMAGLRAVALPDMVPTMTAYGNDDGWEFMYSHFLKYVLLPQDVVVGISCSGNSMNVVNALQFAKEINLPSVKTIAMTGDSPISPINNLKNDAIIHVPFRDIRVQEDCHMIICHALAEGL